MVAKGHINSSGKKHKPGTAVKRKQYPPTAKPTKVKMSNC